MADLSAAAIANAQLFEQVARAKTEWEHTFDSIPDLVAVIDAEHRLARVNRAVAERLHVAPDQLIGQHYYTALHGTEGPLPGCPHIQALVTGKSATLEVEDPHLGGIFLITSSPVVDGEGRAVGSVLIARDITEMKRLEEESRQRQRFEDLSRAKSAFIATMSHELRTPLNAVIGFSELLLGQGVGPLTEKQSRYLGHIQESGKHLLDLINDILDVSRVEAGKIELARQPLPLDEAVEASLALARPQAEKAGVTLNSEIPPDLPPVPADRVRLRQILFNLMSNAIKFTPAGGSVTVSARRASAESRGNGEPETRPPRFVDSPILGEADFLEIRVTDTGIGIKAEDIPKLFREFGQLEAGKAPEKRGTGLGLALTKKLVGLHGGQIWVESEGEGRGSTFEFTLPFAGPAGRET
jgi:signal transduction histidine kinase